MVVRRSQGQRPCGPALQWAQGRSHELAAVPVGYTQDRGILPKLMGPTCDSSTWKSCDPSLTLRCKEPLDPLIQAQPPGKPVMCLSTFFSFSQRKINQARAPPRRGAC